jgi:hypothetical protein
MRLEGGSLVDLGRRVRTRAFQAEGTAGAWEPRPNSRKYMCPHVN